MEDLGSRPVKGGRDASASTDLVESWVLASGPEETLAEYHVRLLTPPAVHDALAAMCFCPVCHQRRAVAELQRSLMAGLADNALGVGLGVILGGVIGGLLVSSARRSW